MFFAVIALILSIVNFMLTFRDGQLVENARKLFSEVGTRIDSMREDDGEPGMVNWTKIQEKLANLETMIASEDNRALPSLDVLREDLEAMRDYSTERGSEMLRGTIETLRSVREQIAEDAPLAISQLRALTARIGGDNDSSRDDVSESPTESNAGDVP